jgi:hypothetical protein
MPNLKITPSSALLTAGQAVTFKATDDANQAVNVAWSLAPEQPGRLVTGAPAPGGQAPAAPAPAPQVQGSSSATYIAPSIVQSAQTVAVTGTSATDTASVSISLTPDAISIIPAAVCLHVGQEQQFVAVVASGSDDAAKVTWILTPKVGDLDDKGLYKPPVVIPDDGTLTVTAACTKLGKQASARVTLTPEPWRGFGPILLAGYLFLVFCVVYLMIDLWPSEIPSIDTLKANVAQAQSNLDKSKLALQTALAASGPGNSGTANPPKAGAPARPPDTSTDTTTEQARQKASKALFDQMTADNEKAQKELDDATKKLMEGTSTTVQTDTKVMGRVNREFDLLCLVLLAGALGSFLHMAQSFSAFAGNRTLKSSWVWWYCFLPFVGAGLALIFYAALRGGLITVAASSGVKTSDLNPYGLVVAAALAGMFSEAATTKLGEVFDTVFQTSKGDQNKDPLKPDSQSSSQAPKASGAAGGALAK